jgi:tetratricopeptide (TPR) repeat protein
MIRVNLAASYVGRGRHNDGIEIADRALRDVDLAKDKTTWINLHITKASAYANLAQGEPAQIHLQEGLAAYRAVVTATPSLEPPARLALLRIAFAQLAMVSFARSGNINDLEEAGVQLKEAYAAIDCSSPTTDRAKVNLALGDYMSQLVAKDRGRIQLLAAATFYEQAMVTANRLNDPRSWTLAASRYANAIGLASWDEVQGGFSFVPDAIAAFDEVISEYRRLDRTDLAVEAATNEVNVFVTLGNVYSDKRRKRALFDRAKIAALRLDELGRLTHSAEVSAQAQRHLTEIDAMISKAKTKRVSAAPFSPQSSPAAPACAAQ